MEMVWMIAMMSYLLVFAIREEHVVGMEEDARRLVIAAKELPPNQLILTVVCKLLAQFIFQLQKLVDNTFSQNLS